MHVIRSARSHEGQRGQALVEFAVTLPLLASAIMGVFEFGVAVAANIGINRAAQNGAHMASSAGNIAGADCIVLDEIEHSVLPPNDRAGIESVRIELTDLDGDTVFAIEHLGAHRVDGVRHRHRHDHDPALHAPVRELSRTRSAATSWPAARR